MKCSECSTPIKPVIAFDIDGTLADYHLEYVRFAERYFNLPPNSLPQSWDGVGEFRDRLGIPANDYRASKLAFRLGGFKRWMPQYPGATRLVEIAAGLGAEVWITTTRPWMRTDNIDPDTREWLQRNRIPYDHLLFDEDKYGLLTQLVDPERIVMVLDDEAQQRDRCKELDLPFVLRHNPWNWLLKADHQVMTLQEASAIVVERMGVRDALKS